MATDVFHHTRTYDDAVMRVKTLLQSGETGLMCTATTRTGTAHEDHTIFTMVTPRDAALLILQVWQSMPPPEERDWRIAQSEEHVIVSTGAYTRVHILQAGSTLCGHFWPDRPTVMKGDKWIGISDSVSDLHEQERCRDCFGRSRKCISQDGE